MNLCLLLQYAPTLYVSSPTIKSFAVTFTTASLLKKEKESWEEILMRKFWPLATTSHNLLRFNIVDKYLFKQHFWYCICSFDLCTTGNQNQFISEVQSHMIFMECQPLQVYLSKNAQSLNCKSHTQNYSNNHNDMLQPPAFVYDHNKL